VDRAAHVVDRKALLDGKAGAIGGFMPLA